MSTVFFPVNHLIKIRLSDVAGAACSVSAQCSYPANSQMEMYNRLREFVSVFTFTWNYLNNLQIGFFVSLIRFYLLLYTYLKEGTVIKKLQGQPAPFSQLHNFLLTIFLQRVNNTLFNALKLHFSNENTAQSCFEIISKAAQSTEQSVW